MIKFSWRKYQWEAVDRKVAHLQWSSTSVIRIGNRIRLAVSLTFYIAINMQFVAANRSSLVREKIVTNTHRIDMVIDIERNELSGFNQRIHMADVTMRFNQISLDISILVDWIF